MDAFSKHSACFLIGLLQGGAASACMCSIFGPEAQYGVAAYVVHARVVGLSKAGASGTTAARIVADIGTIEQYKGKSGKLPQVFVREWYLGSSCRAEVVDLEFDRTYIFFVNAEGEAQPCSGSRQWLVEDPTSEQLRATLRRLRDATKSVP